MSSLRCFVGIPLSMEGTQAAVRAREAICSIDDTWRADKWLSAENLHLTVKFLGDLPQDRIDRFADLLDDVSSRRSFTLETGGVSAVPAVRECRMLWVHYLDPDGAARSLAEAVDAAAVEINVEPERRAFRPHATLCRARRPHAIRHEALAAGSDAVKISERFMSVRRFSLFSSRLTPSGPVYAVLGEWSLAT